MRSLAGRAGRLAPAVEDPPCGSSLANGAPSPTHLCLQHSGAHTRQSRVRFRVAAARALVP